ncbi:MAG: hypothetical protein PHQ50_06790 [Eubacteriales bacterium]|nr:hypothetical protein [Eubacteriales bacterium]
MGTLIKSMRKSKAMKKAAKVITKEVTLSFDSIMNRGEEEERAFQELFNCLESMGGRLSQVIEAYNTNPEELRNLSKRIYLAGFAYQKGDFLPVALVSFASPLTYILENKSQIMDYGYAEIISVVEKTRELL